MVPEAVHLVVKATLLASQKSEIFILEMGEPKNILDIAVKLVEAQGKVAVIEPAPGRELGDREDGIVFTGLKPEETVRGAIDDSCNKANLPKFVGTQCCVCPESCDAITSIEAACEANDVKTLIKVLSGPLSGCWTFPQRRWRKLKATNT